MFNSEICWANAKSIKNRSMYLTFPYKCNIKNFSGYHSVEKPPRKLLEQVSDVIRLKHYSYKTEKSYVKSNFDSNHLTLNLTLKHLLLVLQIYLKIFLQYF